MDVACWFSRVLSMFIILTGADSLALPPEAELEKAQLEAAAAAAETYPSHFVSNVNTGDELLSWISFASNITVNGSAVIQIPSDIVPILPLFDGFVFSTTGGAFEIFWQENGGAITALDSWWGGSTDTFAVRRALGTYTGVCNLIVSGTGTVSWVRASKPTGISLSFDEEPYGIPGSDDPILDIDVSVDATTFSAMSGICHFDRDTLIRVYGDANGPVDHLAAAEYYADKGFIASRSAGINQTVWAEETTPDMATQSVLRDIYKREFDLVRCFSAWPEEYAHDDPSLGNGTGTPATNLFEEAAALSATVVKHLDVELGSYSGAPYCEVKNESDVNGNWAYFGDPDNYDAWGLLAEFHNAVADAVKAANPDWKVGGPSSCMPSLDTSDFERGGQLLNFMDNTHEHLDYYSLHFYERNSFRLVNTNANTPTYLFGRLEGILDTLCNKMYLQDDMKPILVTEYGGARTESLSDVGHWMFIRSASSLMMRFMQRPDQIEMAVPFVIPIAFWSKSTGPRRDSFQLFVYDENLDMQLTELHYFLDFWGGLSGDRIVADSPNSGITVNALLDSNVVRLVVNNLSQQRASMDINAEFGDAVPQRIEQVRMYIENGEMNLETNVLTSLNDVPLAFDETSMINVYLDRVPEKTSLLNRETFYSDKIMQATGGSSMFEIVSPVGSLQGGTLRISLGRGDGFPSGVSVQVNGGSVTNLSMAESLKDGMYYGILEIPVAASELSETNQITVTASDAGGMITSVVLDNEYLGGIELEDKLDSYFSADFTGCSNEVATVTLLNDGTAVGGWNPVRQNSSSVTNGMLHCAGGDYSYEMWLREPVAFEQIPVIHMDFRAAAGPGVVVWNKVKLKDPEGMTLLSFRYSHTGRFQYWNGSAWVLLSSDCLSATNEVSGLVLDGLDLILHPGGVDVYLNDVQVADSIPVPSGAQSILYQVDLQGIGDEDAAWYDNLSVSVLSEQVFMAKDALTANFDGCANGPATEASLLAGTDSGAWSVVQSEESVVTNGVLLCQAGYYSYQAHTDGGVEFSDNPRVHLEFLPATDNSVVNWNYIRMRDENESNLLALRFNSWGGLQRWTGASWETLGSGWQGKDALSFTGDELNVLDVAMSPAGMDLYLNGELVAAEVGFQTTTGSSLAAILLMGNSSSDSSCAWYDNLRVWSHTPVD